MSSDGKVILTVLTTAGAAVFTALAWSLKWPYWPAPLLIPIALGTFLLLSRRNAPASGVEIPSTDYVPLQEAQHREKSVADVPLPSSVAHYSFLFSATVRWYQPGPSTIPNANPGALAIDTILDRARQATATELPTASALAQHRLSSVLGTVTRDASGQVEAWATNISLTLSDPDLDRLQKIADLRKDEEIWEHQRDYERNRRTYLGEDVLKSTGSAVVWWLAKKDDAIEHTVDLIGPLAQLAAAANDSEVPDLFRHLTPQVNAAVGEPGIPMIDFGSSFNGSFLDPDPASVPYAAPTTVVDDVEAIMRRLDFGPEAHQRVLLARWFVKWFEDVGKPEDADQIRQAFSKPDFDEPEVDVPDDDTELPDFG